MRIHHNLLWIVLAACGGTSDGRDGEELVSGMASAALGGANNEARCVTCHATAGAGAGNSGTSLEDIAFRASYKGGGAPDLRAGVNACVTGWMGGTALGADDERWVKLEAYLVSISDPAITVANGLAPEVLADENGFATAYGGGNVAAGAAKYEAACARCHDAGLQLGPARTPARAALAIRGVGLIAQKVRTSGPPPSGTSESLDRTPGPMPFFEPRDLSAQDLKDVIAFLRQ
jgi:mono/diheme cytochrome c family protein